MSIAPAREWRSVMTNVMATQRPLYEIKANLFKGLAHPLRVRRPEFGERKLFY